MPPRDFVSESNLSPFLGESCGRAGHPVQIPAQTRARRDQPRDCGMLFCIAMLITIAFGVVLHRLTRRPPDPDE